MNAYKRPTPSPGRPIRRDGLKYTWVTWAAKILGGHQCEYSIWFKSTFDFAKRPDPDREHLVHWNAEHNAMMREHRALLEENGWTCRSEVPFKLTGKRAILAGKEDLVATMPGRILIVDGKTGRQKDSDFFQVLLYLFARLHQPHREEGLSTKLAGEVLYKGGQTVPVRIADVERHEPAIIRLMEVVAGDTPPKANPDKWECARCPIHREDCPSRYSDSQEERDAMEATTEAF